MYQRERERERERKDVYQKERGMYQRGLECIK